MIRHQNSKFDITTGIIKVAFDIPKTWGYRLTGFIVVHS
jgi:hypothetical protein